MIKLSGRKKVQEHINDTNLNYYFDTSLSVEDTTIGNLDLLRRLVTRVGLGRLDLLHNVHTINYFAKDNVLAIEPVSANGSNEKLRAIRVLAGVSHRKIARCAVLDLKVLVLEASAIDALATSAITVSEIASLDHEVGNDTMKLGSLVALALWLCGQLSKVLNSSWHGISKKTNYNAASFLSTNRYVKVDLLSNSLQFVTAD